MAAEPLPSPLKATRKNTLVQNHPKELQVILLLPALHLARAISLPSANVNIPPFFRMATLPLTIYTNFQFTTD
ncbi:conserved hypothetical protein [Ricinus communis]|uniref:Uncharacterized protein n=1 Tax=Ricinus communis TaxID=3988 RepID=B9SG20_RICCO|nr:conserved hypothetical protein [Ricinus communis]